MTDRLIVLERDVKQEKQKFLKLMEFNLKLKWLFGHDEVKHSAIVTANLWDI